MCQCVWEGCWVFLYDVILIVVLYRERVAVEQGETQTEQEETLVDDYYLEKVPIWKKMGSFFWIFYICQRYKSYV